MGRAGGNAGAMGRAGGRAGVMGRAGGRAGAITGSFHWYELRFWTGDTISSHCNSSTNPSSDLRERVDEGVLTPSSNASVRSTGMMQASGSDSGEDGESDWGSSMKFAIMN